MKLPSVLEVDMKKKLVWGLAAATALAMLLLTWAGSPALALARAR